MNDQVLTLPSNPIITSAKPAGETMPAEQNFVLLKKCHFNTDTKLMEAMLFKHFKQSLVIKLGHSQGANSLLHVLH